MAKYSECVFDGGNDIAQKAGLLLADSFISKGKSGVLKENFGIYKEAGQTTASNTGAYTTLLASTLYLAAIEKIDKILDLVEINEDLKNSGGGFGAIQLPRRTPTIAVEVSEGAVVSYFAEGTDSVTVTCRKVVAGTSLTWEILKRGMTGFATYVMKDAADAISRKLASDILNGLSAGSTLAATTGGISFANVVAAEALVNNSSYANGVKYGFIADALVLTPTSWATFRQDADVKNAIYFASAIPGQPVNAATMPLMMGNLEIVVSPFLTSSLALVLEKKRNILVKESDLETFDGRLPGTVDREVIAVMSYALAMMYPTSVATITA